MEDRTQITRRDTSKDKLYITRAYQTLPFLVRQALAGQSITYGQLAHEVGISNPRHLNKVLGYIGEELIKLGKENEREIPLINYLVINKSTGLPGEGIEYFISEKDFSKLTKSKQRDYVNRQLTKIFAFSDWYWVLDQWHLKPIKPSVKTKQLLAEAKAYKGGGESPVHKAYKEYIAQNPRAICLKGSLGKGRTEYVLPSQDAIDVLFVDDSLKIGIEVKSHISDNADVLRGLFQCIKYKYLLEAEQAVNNEPKNCRVMLVLENGFPEELISEKNILGIEVMDNIKM